MTTEGLISADDIQQRIAVVLNKKKMIIGVGDEGTPDNVADTDWVRQTLRAGSLTYDYQKDNILRFWTSADTKFEDTTMGGNYVVNPRPQFTRYADTRSRGLLTDTQAVKVPLFSKQLGMGHYYSESIDDTHQTIHMIFGQPEFNSLTNYFTNFFSLDASRLANGGRWSEAIANFFKRGTTLFLGIVFWPITLTLYGFSKAADIINFMLRKPASKYYYMRSNMQLYWATVSSIANRIAATSGMVGWTGESNTFAKMKAMGAEDDKWAGGVDVSYKDTLNRGFGEIFNPDGFINVARFANRAQSMRNSLSEKMAADMEGKADFADYVKEMMSRRLGNPVTGGSGISLDILTKAWRVDEQKKFEERFNSEIGKWESVKDAKGATSNITPSEMTIQARGLDAAGKPKPNEDPSTMSKLLDSFNSEFRDGSAFATFRVDHTGAVDESFSSSTGQTDLASTFNNTSAQLRSAKFSLAGGNLVGGGLGAIVGGVVSAVQGVIEGTADYVGLNGILAPGAAFADIPEFWQNSSASLPPMSYSMDLVSPYGDPLSRMMNLYIPLAMLLAAALPLSTGKQSYTSPFLCQVFDQGRAITRLGIVESLQIQRGTSNLAFNKQKNFMALNVSFTIKDLSSVMHMPVGNGFSWDPLNGLFDEDTVFSDYIGVLSSLSLGKSHYLSEKIAMQALNKWRSYQSTFNIDRTMAFIHERTPIGLLDVMFKNTSRY